MIHKNAIAVQHDEIYVYKLGIAGGCVTFKRYQVINKKEQYNIVNL